MKNAISTLRIMESGNFNQKQECSESDFQRVLSMIRGLVRHSSYMFSQLPAVNKSAKLKDKKEQFLEQLPVTFNHQEFIDFAHRLSILHRLAERYIAIFCEKGLVRRDLHGIYSNLVKGE